MRLLACHHQRSRCSGCLPNMTQQPHCIASSRSSGQLSRARCWAPCMSAANSGPSILMHALLTESARQPPFKPQPKHNPQPCMLCATGEPRWQNHKRGGGGRLLDRQEARAARLHRALLPHHCRLSVIPFPAHDSSWGPCCCLVACAEPEPARILSPAMGCRTRLDPASDAEHAAIAGSGPNGAIIHYRAQEGTCADVTPDSLLLVDSGEAFQDAA